MTRKVTWLEGIKNGVISMDSNLTLGLHLRKDQGCGCFSKVNLRVKQVKCPSDYTANQAHIVTKPHRD